MYIYVAIYILLACAACMATSIAACTHGYMHVVVYKRRNRVAIASYIVHAVAKIDFQDIS